jgi:hypothetical protein
MLLAAVSLDSAVFDGRIDFFDLK